MENVDTFLEHHGVKGMKWGVRNGVPIVGKTPALADKFEHPRVVVSAQKVGYGPRRATFAEQRSVGKLTKQVRKKLMEHDEYLDILDDLQKGAPRKSEWSDKEWDSYFRHSESVITKHAEKFTPEGAKSVARFQMEGELRGTMYLYVGSPDVVDRVAKLHDEDQIEHSDGSEYVGMIRFDLDLDEDGRISGFSDASDSVIEHSELNDDFLAHHGVKGMKWGKHKAADPASSKKSRPSSTKGQPVPTRKSAAETTKIIAANLVKYGATPAMAALGVAAPLAIATGVSVRMLSDPHVREAISSAKDHFADKLDARIPINK